MFGAFKKLLGDPNQRKINRLEPIVDHINSFEAELALLDDEALRDKTAYFKQELAQASTPAELKEALDLILPEAFAVCREAGKRVLGMRHYDVQLLGGLVLHQGCIAEMRTGEGKTLVATLPVYLNALTGKGVHVVTVNDYLAKRDAEWMGQLYRFLGLSVGCILSSNSQWVSPDVKRQAYACDITYGTNNEFGFDYLRDQMAKTADSLVQRPFNYAVIDEVDSILIDEARTPLIISGKLERSADMYQHVAKLVPALLKEEHYSVDEKARNVILTEEGIDHAQELLGIEDLFAPRSNFAHYVLQALKAKELYQRDVDYVVKDNQCVIVDEFTGRLMEGRRWSDGLHQSVEAKEGVHIQDETQTLASITFQNLFRLYPKLSGMTGTALTEEAEFGKIYNLEVTCIPTNQSDVRQDLPDLVYKNERVKFCTVVETIAEAYTQGRPVLVGTVSIEKSEALSAMLKHPKDMREHLIAKGKRLSSHYKELPKSLQEIPDLKTAWQQLATHPEQLTEAQFKALAQALEKDSKELSEALLSLAKTAHAVELIQKGLPHQVLNAKQHEQEARIIAQAGRVGAITIATNMAGRGTDILLGGNAEFLAHAELDSQQPELRESLYPTILAEKKKLTDAERETVVAAGGLLILGTERHESRRIDNQLRGRAGRQGDPGASRFFLSLEDSLMRLFGGGQIAKLMDVMNVDETMPISAGLVNRAIENAQRKVEAFHFDTRKNVLHYDDVLTQQRTLIYGQRHEVLMGENLQQSVIHMLQQVVAREVSVHALSDATPLDDEAWQLLQQSLGAYIPPLQQLEQPAEALSVQALIGWLQEKASEAYLQLETHLNEQLMPHVEAPLTESPLRSIEREIVLSVIDAQWVEYLHNLDVLRDGIGLRAYGQKDPLNEYKREAFAMFQNLTYSIQQDVVMLLFHAEVHVSLEPAIQSQEPVVS